MLDGMNWGRVNIKSLSMMSSYIIYGLLINPNDARIPNVINSHYFLIKYEYLKTHTMLVY